MKNKFTIFFLICYTITLFLFGFYVQRSQSAELAESPVQILEVTVTAYSPAKRQTQGHERQMASGKYASVRKLWEMRYVAVSRDLKEAYGLRWGDKIYLEFEIQDLMHKKIENTVDLFLRNKELAKQFGIQKRKIIILKKH
ncbi:unnamed protein product [marine sediment metagenome]|uniref:3D domain-containing protein n=1 Tax=marine sediment metagenome TaxID=412755 RepID=X1IHE1_9ZZZZ